MKEVVLYIAMSLDGYIADAEGGVNWLAGDNSDPDNPGSYGDFVNEVDTVVLGYKTYNQIVTELSPDNWVYAGKKSYVLTHRELESADEIIFVNEDAAALIERMKLEDGGKIWICGGAAIANRLIEANLIDRYHISVMPIILGDGVKLFDVQSKSLELKLTSVKSYNGICDLVYVRR